MQSRDPHESHSATRARFTEVADANFSRRTFLHLSATGSALGFLAANLPTATATTATSNSLPFHFEGVPVSRADKVIVPKGYRATHIYAWGDPVNGEAPPFKPDASNDAGQQAQQAGMGHDGMAWFPFPGDASDRSDRGLLALNHEYADQGLLFTDGILGEMTQEKVRKSQAAHGVSVIAVERDSQGVWKVIASPYSRRYTANSLMQLSGPAAGSPWVRTAQDPSGAKVLGTFNNCACGVTPWGTYLTCEENFQNVFGSDDPNFQPSDQQKRYGFSARGHVGIVDGNEISTYRWWQQDERFDLAQHPNEPNRFGYVVEIDPSDVNSLPRKHTALGRLKHENAAVTLAPDGRVVVYMGDDEKNEYIYKFVSAGRYDENDPRSNHRLLESGTLYAARFDDDGTGEWLELTYGSNGLTKENGFESQADICVHTRQAADRVGATMMDRPEWVAVHPQTREVFVTLTNNDLRGKLPPSSNLPDGKFPSSRSQPPVDAANPRAANVYGQIVKWTEANHDPTATTFAWSHFAIAGDPSLDEQVTIRGDAFGSPDGLWFDPRGILWIQTDVSAAMISQPIYQNLGNNMMLAADPASRTVRRFLTGPVGCEITGMTMTPDYRTMFVNIQHPGEPVTDVSDFKNPMALSTWPDGPRGGRPRSATVVIQRTDGGAIGS